MTQERVKQLEWEVEKLQQYRKESDLDLSQLGKPFEGHDLEWRVQQAGLGKNTGKPYALIVPYITARAIQDRLDIVVGPQNWSNHVEFTDKGVLSTISIKINGEWVSKTDGAPFTDIEGFKGGISDAFKRAAVLWGVGRFLYAFDTTFATFVEDPKGAHKVTIEGKTYFWKAP